jgi:Transglutaminase-like superfamily
MVKDTGLETYMVMSIFKFPVIIKKAFYYKDTRLIVSIFFNFLKISFLCLLGKEHSFIVSGLSKEGPKIKRYAKEKVIRYVGFCSFLGRKIGFKNTCLKYSFLLCYMLRQAGWDAKVNFGAKKENNSYERGIDFTGHCWVTVGPEEIEAPYQLLFRYP